MLDLESAIKHCEEVAQENEKQYSGCPMKYDGAYANNGKTACKCAEEHRQLAEWLKELKALREVCTSKAFDMAIEALGQTDTLDKIKTEIIEKFENCSICEWFEDYDYEENDVSEYREVGRVSDIIDIIDKYLKEVEE